MRVPQPGAQRAAVAVPAGTALPESPLVAAAIFLIALLVRFGLLFQMRDSLVAQTPILDGAYYYQWALKISAGDWKGGAGIYSMSPGYSYLLALLFKFVGNNLTAVYVIQCVVSALSCVLVYRISRRFLPKISSAVAGCLIAVYGGSVFYAELINKASWIEFLNVACVLAILRASERRSLGSWLLPGALLGASAQFRPNILLFLPFIAAYVFLGEGDFPKPRNLGGLAGLLIGAGLTIFPVALRNRVVGGEWALTTAHGGMNFFTGNNPQSAAPYRPLSFARTDPKYEQDDFFAEAQRRAGRPLTRGEASRFWYEEALESIGSDVSGWVVLLGKKFCLLWDNYEQPINQNLYFYREQFGLLRILTVVGYWILAPLGLCGMMLSLRTRAFMPLHLYLLAQALSLVAFFVVSEYRHPMAWALAVYAAAALEWFRVQFRAERIPAKVVALSVFLLALAGLSARGSTPGSLAYRQDLAVAYNNLGSAYMERRRWGDAIVPLQKSLAILPAYGDAHYNLGECYINLDRPKEAEEQILAGMQAHPGYVLQHYLGVLAHAYAAQGDFEKAKKELKTALDSDPTNAENLRNLALMYNQTGQRRQAALVIDKLLSGNPNDTQGLMMAVEFAIAEKNAPKIFDLLPRLVSAAPDDPMARDLIGSALAASGHYVEAKAEFQRALALRPDSGSAKSHLESVDRILSRSGQR